MAYDPNYPYGNYNPYGNYQPTRQQPQLNTYAFVNGLEGAKNYPVPTNQSMLLMDSTQSVCYLKSVNALGQMVLKCFKLAEVSEADLTLPAQPTIEYATRADLESLTKRIEKLEPKKEGE